MNIIAISMQMYRPTSANRNSLCSAKAVVQRFYLLNYGESANNNNCIAKKKTSKNAFHLICSICIRINSGLNVEIAIERWPKRTCKCTGNCNSRWFARARTRIHWIDSRHNTAATHTHNDFMHKSLTDIFFFFCMHQPAQFAHSLFTANKLKIRLSPNF